MEGGKDRGVKGGMGDGRGGRSGSKEQKGEKRKEKREREKTRKEEGRGYQKRTTKRDRAGQIQSKQKTGSHQHTHINNNGMSWPLCLYSHFSLPRYSTTLTLFFPLSLSYALLSVVATCFDLSAHPFLFPLPRRVSCISVLCMQTLCIYLIRKLTCFS